MSTASNIWRRRLSSGSMNNRRLAVTARECVQGNAVQVDTVWDHQSTRSCSGGPEPSIGGEEIDYPQGRPSEFTYMPECATAG